MNAYFMTVFAVIGAAGMGKRMQLGMNKALLMIRGQSMLQRSVAVIGKCPSVDQIIVMGNADDLPGLKDHLAGLAKVTSIALGGKERQDSMGNGLKEAQRLGAKKGDLVAFHDAARCLVKVDEVENCLSAGKEFGAAVAGCPAKDTTKRVKPDGFVLETIPRSELFVIQTPQVIEFELAAEAFGKAFAEGFYGTDDVSLVERLGKPVKVVVCSSENIKLTTPDDVAVAEAILSKRGE